MEGELEVSVILVTGSDGFIGKNLVVALQQLKDVQIRKFDIHDSEALLEKYLNEADIVFHLAGVNRPKNEEEFQKGNTVFTKNIVDLLEKMKKKTRIVFSSSIQAKLRNPYGISKKKAEDILLAYAKKNEADVYVYRLPNVFGKWCRPDYNSVVATFCNNIARGEDIAISDNKKKIELVYIDDVVEEFTSLIDSPSRTSSRPRTINRAFKITLGELAKKIRQFKELRKTLIVPDLSDDLTRFLCATYLSYLGKADFSYKPEQKTDQRGMLAELLKSRQFGQIFVSKSNRGVIRGNHYHSTKIEKFCVLQGNAVIKLRHILNKEVLSYPVSGGLMEIVDIPPGYTHAIENTGDDELVVLFWASSIFDPDKPDTYFQEV